VPGEAARRERREDRRRLLVALTGEQVTVADGGVAVGEVDVREPLAPGVDQVEGALPRSGGVGEVEGEVVVVAVSRVPAGE
jgi:hypothetical protein